VRQGRRGDRRAHGARPPAGVLKRSGEQRIKIELAVLQVHPYNDPDVIAGQGTIGLEFVRQVPALDTIVVPVSGGGMIRSGTALVTSSGSVVRMICLEFSVPPSSK
jgi:threonine dehydratase